MSDDRSIRQHISDLVEEERQLRYAMGRHEIEADDEHARLRAIEVELDQCWDLLRQRDAQHEFGGNPDTAQVRSSDVVEGYQG